MASASLGVEATISLYLLALHVLLDQCDRILLHSL